jgi:hypothetical protein
MDTPTPFPMGKHDGLPGDSVRVPEPGLWHAIGFGLAWALGLALWLLTLLVLTGS